jgi:hypothetical protein
MSPAVQSVVSDAMETLEDLSIPRGLRDRIDQHQQNLTDLAGALLAGGQEVDEVRDTISAVLESFKDELLNTIIALREGPHAQ